MTQATRHGAQRFLAIYLCDHHAGSAAGLSLVRRCRASNTGTPLGTLLAQLEGEFAAEREVLEAVMGRLGVTPNPVKTALGSMAAVVARLKSNGRLFSYSPLSRLVELESLAAGIFTKRNLWRALRSVADRGGVIDADELDNLIAQATSQYERVLDAHDEAAAVAFSAAPRDSLASSSR